MPRLKNRPPRMYCDRGRAYVNIDGPRFPLGPWGSDQAVEQYRRLIAEWYQNGQNLPARHSAGSAPEPVTVTELCVEFREYVKKRYQAGERANHHLALQFVCELYGTQPVEQFGPRALAVVRDRMIEQAWSR